MISKLWATKEIYDIVVRAINARESSGVSRNDTLQMLLDAGDDRLVVVGVSVFTSAALFRLILPQFIMGLLIAGARATGTTGTHTL
jgi:sterol 14-demethylase